MLEWEKKDINEKVSEILIKSRVGRIVTNNIHFLILTNAPWERKMVKKLKLGEGCIGTPSTFCTTFL